MPRLAFALALILVGVVLASAQLSGTLYAVVGKFAKTGGEDFLVGIDVSTGQRGRETVLMRASNVLETYLGISAFDNSSKILYYSNDWANGLVFPVNTTSGQMLPPLNLGVEMTTGLTYDPTTGLVWSVGMIQEIESALKVRNFPYIQSFTKDFEVNFFYQFKSHFVTGVDAPLIASWPVVDTDNGILYVYLANETDYYMTNPGELWGFDLSTGKVVSKVSVNCYGYLEHLAYDPTTMQIRTVASFWAFTNPISFEFFTGSIDPATGNCSANIQFQIPKETTLDCVSFDANTQTYYAAGFDDAKFEAKMWVFDANSGGVLKHIAVPKEWIGGIATVQYDGTYE